MKSPDLAAVMDFLPCSTPDAWLAEAAKPERLPQLLCEHADLELKAAQAAMTTIRRYASGKPGVGRSKSEPQATATAINPGDRNSDLLNKMSRLAREELRHFEQVLALMGQRQIDYVYVSPSRYAGALHQLVRSHEPARLVDTLIVGAFIEARSCERFAALAPLLEHRLGEFYQSLLKSESRHYQDYLQLARRFSEAAIEPRIDAFRQQEALLIQSTDESFRFHSGVPYSATIAPV